MVKQKKRKLLKIVKVIDDCLGCVYCEYDPYYDCARDSGYNCKLVGRRIIDDYDFNCLEEQEIPIPDWCPLEDVSGGEESD